MTNDFLNYAFHFLTFFLAGLAVNLTPCVYPMLSVTVSLFRKEEEGKSRIGGAFFKALIYVLGMAVMYSSLGFLAAKTGALFGGILQNPWVLLLASLLMFLLALSMFGVYQLRFPARWLNQLAGLRKTNYLGLFLSGTFVGVFAAPCIGPPVIALLASVAGGGDPLLGFFSFFVFSLGLGLPYLILGTFAGSLKELPKAGSWLLWVERLFGVILLSFSLFYLMLALDFELKKWLLPASFILGGVYLGFFESSGKEQAAFVRFKWGAGVISSVAGMALIAGLVSPQKRGLTWEPYQSYKLNAAKARHKPVVIDFYADWCLTCHELDNLVFKNPAVKQALTGFVLLRVDATDMGSSFVEKVLEEYDIFGLPIVVFIDSRGEEVKNARVIGYVTPQEFLKSITLTLEE